MIKSIKKLFNLLTYKEKKIFLLMFFFMLIATFLETLSIAIIIPFARYIFINDSINLNLNFINAESNYFPLYFLSIILIVFLLKNVYLLIFKYWYTIKINFFRVRVAYSLFENYLYKDYKFYLEHNTSELVRNNYNEVGLLSKTVFLMVILLTEIMTTIGLFGLMFYITPLGFIIAASVFIPVSLIFYQLFKMQFLLMGRERLKESDSFIRKLIEGFNAIKEIRNYNAENIFLSKFNKHSVTLANLSTKVTFINYLPSLFLEYLGIITFVLIFYILFYIQGASKEEILVILSLYIIASLRIMPSVGKILVAFQSFRNYSPSLDIIYNELKNYNPNSNQFIQNKIHRNINFKQSISLKNVSFYYSNRNKYILKNFNLKINSGEVVGIVGESGKGKTTLCNILLGLLEPKSGDLLINDEIQKFPFYWGKNVGVVSQTLYLTDETIKENIAFGLELNQIDEKRINLAIKMSQLEKFISELPDGLMTLVGERGIKLSGGQLQRLGIARALYNDPKILVFDEATSQLDEETEKKIVEIIYTLKAHKTIILITHNLSILDKCDKIINLNEN